MNLTAIWPRSEMRLLLHDSVIVMASVGNRLAVGALPSGWAAACLAAATL